MSVRAIEVLCDVDIAQTPETFHAHAVPDGIEIRPGDRVLVHDAPVVGFGGHATCRCGATVIRAGWLRRIATRIGGIFDLTELYEVGFDAKDVR